MEPASFASTILTALAYILRLEAGQLQDEDRFQFEQEQIQPSATPPYYDFIVVGAGTAGCIVASRLSEKYTVLLLEAGGTPPPSVAVPAFYEYAADAPDINYFYKSIPQQNAGNRSIMKTMGKMLGGTGSHNALVFNRGSSRDYDNWAELTRDPSWKYDSLMKYWIKAENYSGKFTVGDQHGTEGPLFITTSTRPINSIWKKAASELNFEYGDPNGPQMEGFTPSEVLRKEGRRVTTYTGYIEPFLKIRQNLKVVKYADVQKILFTGLKATGVSYVRHGVKLSAYASKEVIVCAGVFGSPLLLFKSGIGPSDMLNEANISVKADIPAVGKNLQDHPGVSVGPFTVNNPSKLSTVNNNLTEEIFEKYQNYESETVLSETGLGPQAFFVSEVAKEKNEADWPDIQFFHVGTNFGSGGRSASSPPNQFNVAILVGRPELKEGKSGSIKLNTKAYRRGVQDNVELAILDYKFLKSKQDANVLREGIKIAMKVFSTKAFKSIGTKLEPHPKCVKKNEFDSDEYWYCYIMEKGTSWWHTAGTCRMGNPDETDNFVVDSNLRVRGLEGLRVVDASIMPHVTNANTNAAVIVIAEKASDDIISEHRTGFDKVVAWFKSS